MPQERGSRWNHVRKVVLRLQNKGGGGGGEGGGPTSGTGGGGHVRVGSCQVKGAMPGGVMSGEILPGGGPLSQLLHWGDKGGGGGVLRGVVSLPLCLLHRHLEQAQSAAPCRSAAVMAASRCPP